MFCFFLARGGGGGGGADDCASISLANKETIQMFFYKSLENLHENYRTVIPYFQS